MVSERCENAAIGVAHVRVGIGGMEPTLLLIFLHLTALGIKLWCAYAHRFPLLAFYPTLWADPPSAVNWRALRPFRRASARSHFTAQKRYVALKRRKKTLHHTAVYHAPLPVLPPPRSVLLLSLCARFAQLHMPLYCAQHCGSFGFVVVNT